MKRIVHVIAIALVIISVCIFVASCGDDTDYTEIETFGMVYENGMFKVSVPSDVTEMDLSQKFSVSDKASYTISKTEDFSQELESSVVNLENGSNIYFVKISDKKHEAVYKFNIYKKQILTVNFEVNGGTAVAPITIEEGKSIEAPTSSKIGYILAWDFDFSKPITENVTINAQWTPRQYKITLDAAGTSLDGNVVDVTFGNSITLDKPTKTGYEFKNWLYKGAKFDTSATYSFTEDITLVASFDAIEYSITYVVESGATNNNTIKKFNVESVIELLDAEWKNNDEKRFVGWFTAQDFSEESKIRKIENISQNLTLYAKFEDVIFTNKVNLYVNDVLLDSLQLEFTYKSPYSITFIPDVDDFHKFEGWTCDGVDIASEGVYWPYKTEVDLEAKITARSYEIEYVLNDANALNNEANPNSFTSDEEVTLLNPTSTNECLYFIGWYTSIDFKESSKIEKITSDLAGQKLTLYAKWQYRSTVTFDAGSDLNVDSVTFNYGEEYSISAVERDRYIFDGWYYGDDKLSLNGTWTYKENVELVARWIPIQSTITYILNGGIQNEGNVTEYDVESGIIVLLDPSWENGIKKFAGWYTDSELKNKIEEIDATEHDGIILYAKWEEKNVTIKFDANGGQTGSESMVVTLGSNYAFGTPERLGYDFDAWYYGETRIDLNGVWMIDAEEITLVAKWTAVKYTIEYDLDGGSADGLVNEYTSESDDIVLPIPYKENHAFIGWKTKDGSIIKNVTISKGSVGDRSYVAQWFKNRDENGFVYELREDVMVIIGFDKQIDTSKDYVDDIYIPGEYNGYKVTAIGSRAFAEFGAKFNQATYVNSNGTTCYYRDGHDYKGFTKIYVSTNINLVGAYAFEGCYGMKIQLYSPSGDSMEPKAWEQTGVTYEAGNLPARDCIWGFRPALGWSRYSLAEIPEDY
ncbi:MAG: InlB B-repeat-containing protein [Clostridia bacterium]|nr:InlB B-repeat-containing protein [Clostridia bacterium]